MWLLAVPVVIGLLWWLWSRGPGLWSRGQPKGAVHLQDTLRLYKDRAQFVWVFEHGAHLFIDTGRIGEPATQEVFPLDQWAAVLERIEQCRADGFAEIAVEDMQLLEVVYEIPTRFAGVRALTRRSAVEDLIQEHFGPTGQGYWIGSSSGMNTMEVTFLVANFEISRRSVAALLEGTTHEDYLAIRNDDTLLTPDEVRAAHPNR